MLNPLRVHHQPLQALLRRVTSVPIPTYRRILKFTWLSAPPWKQAERRCTVLILQQA